MAKLNVRPVFALLANASFIALTAQPIAGAMAAKSRSA